jgi:hypothetical protein
LEIDRFIDDTRFPLYRGKREDVDNMFIYNLNIILGGAFDATVVMSNVIGYDNDLHERYFDYIREAQENKYIRKPMVALLLDPDDEDPKMKDQIKKIRSKYDLSDIIIKPKDLDDVEKVFAKIKSPFHQGKLDLVRKEYLNA